MFRNTDEKEECQLCGTPDPQRNPVLKDKDNEIVDGHRLKCGDPGVNLFREKNKYEFVWQHSEYRNVAPGQSSINTAYYAMGCGERETLVDYGCGTGRAARDWAEKGLEVTAVDIAENCLDKGVQEEFPFEFKEACLWQLPEFIGGDYAYCTDVLEHIPEQFIEGTLAIIAERTSKAAYFVVATFDDQWFGLKLHMTVKTAAWWKELFTKCFPGATYEINAGRLHVLWKQ